MTDSSVVIRKTGAYVAPESQIAFDLANDPDAALDKLIEAVSMAREERAKRLAADVNDKPARGIA